MDLINAAYADGQLTETERDDKVSRALVARTLGDVRQTTADLQGDPVVRPTAAGRPRGVSRRAKAGMAAAVLVVAGIGGAAALDGSPDEASGVQVERPYVVEVDADLVDDLLADYEEQFGTTESYGVFAMPDWTRVHVPTDDGRARYVEWSLVAGGELERTDDPVGADELRLVDLAEVDTVALERNLDRARTGLGVEDVEHVEVSIAQYSHDDEPRVTINVVNAFEENAFLVTDLSGEVLEEEPWRPGAS